MKYADLFFDDTVNGTGFRASLFVSGCNPPHCKGCWSPQARDFNYGKEFTEETKQNILESLNKSHVRGISILGGEPMDNLEDGILLDLVKTIKEKYPTKTIFCWSGYAFEELIKYPNSIEFLCYVDMLRDGEYIDELKDLTQYLQGSKNQRCLDVQESLKKGEIILWKP